VTDKQRVVKLHEMQEIDGYGWKDFEKRKVLRQEWKTPREMSTTGPGSEHDDGEELADNMTESINAQQSHLCNFIVRLLYKDCY